MPTETGALSADDRADARRCACSIASADRQVVEVDGRLGRSIDVADRAVGLDDDGIGASRSRAQPHRGAIVRRGRRASWCTTPTSAAAGRSARCRAR